MLQLVICNVKHQPTHVHPENGHTPQEPFHLGRQSAQHQQEMLAWSLPVLTCWESVSCHPKPLQDQEPNSKKNPRPYA